MRKRGAKRKRTEKDKDESEKPSTSSQPVKAPTRAKRVKASKPKPEPEPEYFEDKRNLEDLWKAAFPVGTEWDQLDAVYQFNWDFTNLENAFEEGGVLHGKKVYLFGCTEPQLVPFKGENKLIYIPVVVAVILWIFSCSYILHFISLSLGFILTWSIIQDFFFLGTRVNHNSQCSIDSWCILDMFCICFLNIVPKMLEVDSPFPPSDKIGINSVQREAEEIVPMKQMKMGWIPYIPLENRDSQVDRLKHQIFILGCTQRRAALKHLKIDRVKKYEYCLPYFYQPLKEDELLQSTEVQIIFPAEPKPVFCEFDWELDELEEFTDKLILEEELSEDQKDAFKDFVKEKVREAKKANREAREARKKALEEMSEETKKAFESMRFYKFYPMHTPDTPDVSNVKAPFINRYYGKAHEVL
ncbi:hypothetical protein K2173_005288 [Erythroxylum novogranatense]|uniref:Protein HEAT INTOLERANT 4-like n=1 Tax=Erythroxylum novogranatense TaxID=1862640 RepID=A0AAV8TTX9_9ROSI|nr:hypothetical protein K2173_005288 [Erythroxylum novogranatense]